MAVRKMSSAIAIFSLMVALSYGFAQVSRVHNLNAETMELSQIHPVSGRIYLSRGDLTPGDPADIDAGSDGSGGIPRSLASGCGPNVEGGNYLVQKERRICSLLRDVDPRLYRLEYLRAAPEP